MTVIPMRERATRVLGREAIVGQPPRKPLYLMTRERARVDALAAALVFKSDGHAVQTFPLARVTRIICRNHIDWSGRALATCFNEGIFILWVNGHGHATGHARSPITKPESLSTLIECYLELKDWPRRFENWLARRRLAAVTAAAKRRLENGHVLDTLEFASLKREYVHNGVIVARFHPEVQAWCVALTQDRLMRLGLEDCYHGVGGTRLELGNVLADLLWAELNIEAGTLTASDMPTGTLARVFETWAGKRERHVIDHLGDLHRHLCREVDAWH